MNRKEEIQNHINDYNFKSCYSKITISKQQLDTQKPLSDLIEHKMIDYQNNIEHSFEGYIEKIKVDYRRYRRGKNRCWICGLKLGTKEHEDFE